MVLINAQVTPPAESGTYFIEYAGSKGVGQYDKGTDLWFINRQNGQSTALLEFDLYWVLEDTEAASMNWVVSHMEQQSQRYKEAEKLLNEVAEMNWIKRVFDAPALIKTYFREASIYNF